MSDLETHAGDEPPLRILYHHRIRADDGQAVHVREMIAAMRRLGHDVLECALVTKAPKPGSPEPAAAPVSPAAPEALRDPDASGESAPKPSLWQRLRLPRSATEVLEIAYNRKGQSMLKRAVREFQPHFIYERHALHLSAGLDVAQRAKLPLLLEVNSPMTIEMERLGLLRYPSLARKRERRVLAEADCVLPVTETLADMLVELGGRRPAMQVVGNGAEPSRYGPEQQRGGVEVRRRFGLADNAFVLGFIGYMRPWHRLDLVLTIMQQPGFEALNLLLVGEGPALADLRELARTHGIDDRVHVAGVVPPELVPAHACAFDAALIPAINEYASPLKLFDSLAAGVVTLAPDQRNVREMLTDGANGLLFEPGSAESLASKLGPLLSAGPERAQELGAAGRASLIDNDWTWTGNARRVVAAYQRVSGALPAQAQLS